MKRSENLNWQNNDQKFINLALNLAYKNVGSTASNPIVGCVIVKNDVILGTGITSLGGRPHAEINAIHKVNDKNQLFGATLYVTLEPCSHIGKTLPCVDEIIKHQFSRVVICLQDPDIRVNGLGIKKLNDAGIKVEVGIDKERAQYINRCFIKSRIKLKPFITVKIATSLDGKIATANFDSRWISSQEARHYAHYLRSRNQAIMVGAQTILHDNPELNCRIQGLEQYSPIKIILSNNLNFTYQENIFLRNQQFPTIILTGAKNLSNQNLQQYLSTNPRAQTIYCDTINNKIDLKDAIFKLNQEGINSILIEGGASLISQFISQNLVDELIWIRSNKIIGNDGIPAIGNLGIESINNTINQLKLVKISQLADDIIEIYR